MVFNHRHKTESLQMVQRIEAVCPLGQGSGQGETMGTGNVSAMPD